MCTKQRLDAVEIRFREWWQSKVDRLSWREVEDFRAICDEMASIRRGLEYGKGK
jgi:hypothetical protein